MVFGSLVTTRPFTHYIKPVGYKVVVDENGLSNILRLDWIDFETLGQYTGLKDKDGVEIYEGDIVEFSSDHNTVNGVVKYGINAFQNLKNIGFYIEWENDGENMWGDWWRNDILFWNESGLKVIGNIHDNPEILSEQQPTIQQKQNDMEV